MEGEFKPSKEVLFTKILWLFGPAVFCWVVYLLSLFRFVPAIPVWSPLGLVVIIGTAVGISRANWLYGQTLKINGRGLVITDLFGQTHSYDWRLIQSPFLETSKWLFFPPRLVFSFKYHEGGEAKYHLSELSPADREKAVGIIKCYLPATIDFDLNHPDDLTPII